MKNEKLNTSLPERVAEISRRRIIKLLLLAPAPLLMTACPGFVNYLEVEPQWMCGAGTFKITWGTSNINSLTLTSEDGQLREHTVADTGTETASFTKSTKIKLTGSNNFELSKDIVIGNYC